jgi:hypothetical protein
VTFLYRVLGLDGLFEQTREMYLQAVGLSAEVDADVQLGLGVLFHMQYGAS